MMRVKLSRLPILLVAVLILSFSLVTPAPLQDADADRALQLFRTGRYEEARAAVKRALDNDRENPSLMHLYGLTLGALNRFQEAESQLRNAIRISPGNAGLRNDFGALLVRQNKQEEALGAFEKAVQLDPEYFSARLSLGRILHNLSRSDEALRQFRYVTGKDPRYPLGHYHVATVLINNGQADEALSLLEIELENNPGFAPAHFELARLHLQMGRPKEALTHLRQARGSGVIPEHLSHLLVKALRADGQVSEAIETARAGTSRYPAYAPLRYVLAQLYRDAGKPEMARVEIEIFRKLSQEQ